MSQNQSLAAKYDCSKWLCTFIQILSVLRDGRQALNFPSFLVLSQVGNSREAFLELDQGGRFRIRFSSMLFVRIAGLFHH